MSRKITKKNIRDKKQKIFSKKHYLSGDGMQTSIWGPNLWHYLHTISFNYPVKPTSIDKKYYKQLIYNLQYTLPCKYCRINFKNNLKMLPLTPYKLKDRTLFSRYIYDLHELVNKMLNKNSGLSYSDARDRYEFFRSRCNNKNKKHNSVLRIKTKGKKLKERGCIDPLYGKKSKCIITIVPQDKKRNTLRIDKKCFIGGKYKGGQMLPNTS